MYSKSVLLYFIFNIFLVGNCFANVTTKVLITQNEAEESIVEEDEFATIDTKPILGTSLGPILKEPKLFNRPVSQHQSGYSSANLNSPTRIYEAPLLKKSGVKHRTTKTHPPSKTNQKKNNNKDRNNNKASAPTKSKSSTASAESSSKCTNTKQCSKKTVKQQPTDCSSKNKCGKTKTKSTQKRETCRRRCYTSSNSSETSDSSCTDSDSESSETETDSSDYTDSDSEDSETESSSESDDSSESSDSEDSYTSSSDNNCCCYFNTSDSDTENSDEQASDFEYTINSSHSNSTDRLTFDSSTSGSNFESESNESDGSVDIGQIDSYSRNQHNNTNNDSANAQIALDNSDVILIAISPPMIYLNSTDSDSEMTEINDPVNEENSDDSENINPIHNHIFTISINNNKTARSSLTGERYNLEIPTVKENERDEKKNISLPEEELKIMNLNENFKQHLESLHDKTHKHIGDFMKKSSNEKGIKEKLDKLFQQLNGTKYEPRSSVVIQTDFQDIERNLKENPIWHGSIGGNAKYKEELHIKDVNINKNLIIDSPVTEWVGLNNKAVGRYHNRLTLVTTHEDNFRVNNVEFAEAISAMFMFELWNAETQTLDTILITAQDARANWYNFSGENTLEQLWTWELIDPISDILVFQIYDQWKVVIGYATPAQNSGKEKENNGYSAIFGANLWKDWWLEQKFPAGGRPAAVVCTESAYIAIPRQQHDDVVIYKYNGQKRTYEENKVIESPGVTQVVAFTSGFSSFFAVTGDNSGIYQVKSGSLVQRHLEQYHLDHVESWLPINLDYYTNDMVLMFQHKLDHYTHTSTVIEALKWNRENKKFELMEHQSCHTHQSEVYGFACITDAEGDSGIKGAAAVNFNHKPNIIMASEQYSPLLFDVNTKKVERIDPVQKEVLNVYYKLKELQSKYVNQKNTMDETVKKLASHKKKIKGRNWTIEKLHAPSINLIGNVEDFLIPDSSFNVGGQKWVRNTPLSRYKTAIEGNAKRVKAILNKLKKAVKKSDKLENIDAPFYFNGGLSVKGKVVADKADIKMLNNINVDGVFNNVLQKSQDNMFHVIERKVDYLNVNNLIVSGSINGISVSDLSQGSIPIIIHDDFKLETRLKIIENVRLKGLLNNIDVNKDIIRIAGADNFGTRTKIYSQFLKFSHLEARNQLNIERTMNGIKVEEESLQNQFERNTDVSVNEVEELTLFSAEIGGDLKVDSVNGIKWEQFENNLVFRNKPTDLEELYVSGDVIALGNVAINTLNKLAFPSEYVTKQEPSPIIISGNKIFESELKAYSLDCAQVNGVSPMKFVRLSADQQLGNFTFYDLRITEKLDIGGDIVGKDLHKILANPLITETNIISSNIIFKNLKVSGNVYLGKNINGTDGNKLASDLIYKTDDFAEIPAPKHFLGEVTIKNGLNVASGFINNFKIDDFITSDSEQYFKRDIILGNVRFDRVNVKGLFGNLNMSDLKENAVKTDENEQIVHGEIHFRSTDYSFEDYSARDVPEAPVQINNLVVMNNCNGWKVPEDVVTLGQARQKLHSVLTTFQHLLVKELVVDGDIITQHKVAGVDIRKFDMERFSLTKNQVITGIYQINNCSVEGNLNVNSINGVSSEDIIGTKQKVDMLLEDVFTGRLVIDNLHVNGNLMTSGINAIQLQFMAENAIWLNKENHIPGKITFLEQIEVNNLQVDGDFGDIYFPDFLLNVVRKNDAPLELRGTITFTKTLDIIENLEVEYINNMLATNIILKTKMEDIYNNVFVNGDIHVNNLNVDGYFNSVHLQNLQNVLSSSHKDEFHMNGNIQLQNEHRINNFHVHGLVNNYNLNDVFDSLIWLNKDSNSNAEVIFRNPVTVLGNVQVNNLYNGIHLQTFIEDVVYIDEDCSINANIVFKQPIIIGEVLNIKESILSDMINGYKMSEWRDKAIYLDRPEVLTGIYRMNNVTIKGNLNVNILNNLDLNTIITLDTDQVLLTNLHVGTWKAEGNISVASLVNMRKLKDLYDNTLMNYGNQRISTPLIFLSNVSITKNIEISLINNIPVKNIVTLNTNQILNGSYIFDSAVTANNMEVSGKISQINFNEWIKNAVFTSKNGAKFISGRWFVKGNVTLVNKMVGNEIIDGHNMTQIQNYLADTEKSIEKFNHYLSSSYKQICHDLITLSKKLEVLNQFKSLQEIQSITTPSIYHVLYIEIKKKSYILIQYSKTCYTAVWKWISEKEILTQISEIETGHVLYWNRINVNSEEFISSKSLPDEFCMVKGTNIWDFGDQNVKLKLSLPNVNNISPLEDKPTKINAEELGIVQRYIMVNKTHTMPINNEHSIHRANHSAYTITKIVIGNKELWAHTLLNKIEIYDKSKTLLQTIATTHPTFLTSIRINHHYTLIAFIKNNQSVHTFMYKGLEMFKQVGVLHLEADKLTAVKMRDRNSLANFLLASGKNFVKIIKVVMSNDISSMNMEYCNEM